MKHIIKKQIIDLTLAKKLDAFSIQQKISDQYHAKIVPLLQQAFDAISSEDEVITIDRLEVNIGTINLKELEKAEWTEKIFKSVSEQLIPLPYELKPQMKIVKNMLRLSDAHKWIFYMRHGYLSWNVLEINGDWYKNILEAFAADSTAIHQLRELISHYPNAVKRMATEHSESFLKALVETLTAENQASLPRLIDDIVKLTTAETKNRKIPIPIEKRKQKLWMQILQMTASSALSLTSVQIARLLVVNNFSGTQLNTKKIRTFMSRNGMDIPLRSKTEIEPDKESRNLSDITSGQNHSEIEFKAELNEGEIYVINAGVVLLHPFLQRFFNKLQLIKDDFFKNVFSQQKALYLLHYLATGNTRPLEHEMVILKVLCSFPLENPVDFIELNEEEIAEAESLVESAIGQWDILKGTSQAALREGFLQRKGKLFTNNGILLLQIEQSAIDILLDHLPWNLSIIKLPWMKEILRVEWR